MQVVISFKENLLSLNKHLRFRKLDIFMQSIFNPVTC